MKKSFFLIAYLVIFFLGLSAVSFAATKEVLDNGLTILVKEDHAHPIVTVHANVSAGLSSEGEYLGCGISHFVEHMLFKGTSKRKADDIEHEVKSYGGAINASTNLDGVSYYVTLPKERLEKALELIDDILFNPRFDQKEMKREKDVILKETKMNADDPARRVMRELWHTAYRGHPYGVPVIGYEELFKGLKREDLLKYHSSRYVPDNIILTVTGDVDTRDVVAVAKLLFGKHSRKRFSYVANPPEPRQNTTREKITNASINLAYIAIGYHTVNLSDSDLFALDVLSTVIGDGNGSRLYKRLIKEEGLLYSVASYNYTPRFPGIFIVYAAGECEDLGKAKDVILEEIEKIKTAGVEEGELAKAGNIAAAGYINSLETTGGLAGAISQGEFLCGDPLFHEKYVEGIKAVTVEDVKKVAEKYLKESNLTISYLRPEPLMKEEGEKKKTAETKPEKIELSNGLRVILKEDRRLPKVSLVCVFLGGLRAESKEKNGISNLTALMLLKGTKNRPEDKIKPFMEDLGGSILHFSGLNTFGLSMDFLSEDTDEALDLVGDVVKNPVFPDEELVKAKERVYAAIKAEDDDIYDAGFLKLRRLIFRNHPYGLRSLGEEKTVNGITAEEIRDFYETFCAPRDIVISVVGDFDAGKISAKLETLFGDLNKKSVEIKTSKEMRRRESVESTSWMKREQSVVLAGFGGTTFDNKDRYALEIITSVMSGSDGRLYRSVRDKLGLSYALGMFSVPGLDPGYIVSFAGTDKKRMGKAKAVLLKELEGLKRSAVPEEEIKLAKRSLIGKYRMGLQRYGSLAYRTALDELYGAGYDTYISYPRFIEKISAEDVAAAAKKYIDLESMAVLTVVGEED